MILLIQKYSKMEETNIEGVIGLEMLRHDLAQMGYGLPWGFSKLGTGDLVSSTISYNESADSIGSNFNDASGGVPGTRTKNRVRCRVDSERNNAGLITRAWCYNPITT